MIYLEKNGKLQLINNWIEIESLNGFTSNLILDPSINSKVIGQYERKNPNQCGLSRCKRSHKKGFIIKTNSSEITNVGHICGRKYFGAEFDSQRKSFIEKVNQERNIQVITKFLSKHEDYYKKLHNLIFEESNGWRWILKQIDIIKDSRPTPITIVDLLTECIKNKDDRIYLNWDNESEKKLIGRLKGLKVFYPENNITKIIALDLVKPLKEIKALDIEKSTARELNKWSKTTVDFERNLNIVEDIVKAGRMFFSSSNIEQLREIAGHRFIVKFKDMMERWT